MECKPRSINASSFADNVSPAVISFAINLALPDFAGSNLHIDIGDSFMKAKCYQSIDI